MARPAVLLIDDNPLWLKLENRLLFDCDYEMRFAITCAEGLRLAAARRPDCVVLDYHLRDGSAKRLCSGIRALPGAGKVPIVILTSDPTVETEAYEDCRADMFLLKTDAVDGLPALIERLLASRVS